MPLLVNIGRDSFHTSPLAAYVVKLWFKHIIMEYNMHDLSMWLCNIIINSFVHFLADNPGASSFDNN